MKRRMTHPVAVGHASCVVMLAVWFGGALLLPKPLSSWLRPESTLVSPACPRQDKLVTVHRNLGASVTVALSVFVDYMPFVDQVLFQGLTVSEEVTEESGLRGRGFTGGPTCL